jgi:hypothetical protein
VIEKIMLAAAALFVAGLVQQVLMVPPPPAGDSLAGPLDFCAEDFSIRLEQGESVEWRPAYQPGTFRYSVEGGGFSANISRFTSHPPSDRIAPLSLPLSPVSRRRVFQAPTLSMSDGNGKDTPIVTYGIQYFLYGQAEAGAPLMLLGFADREDTQFPFVGRVDPRPLGERGCTPSRTDPALARRIRHYAGR